MMSLLSLLKTIPDPRSRRRREYPLHGMLAVLILAAAHGENSLRGMWQWAREREEKLLSFWPLGLWANHRLPSLGTFWHLLTHLSPDALQGVLQAWGGNETERALDGKVLRGSKRAEEPALRVVTMMGQRLHQVLAQQAVEGGDELAAALRLLEAEDLAGKVISMDAGLLKAPLVRKVVEKGGAYIGLIKDNQPWLKQALEDWLLSHRPQATNSRPGWEKSEKKHGRWEVRKLWLVACDEDMQVYLQKEFGWPGMQACGWIVRYRKNLLSGKEEETCSLWVAGAAFRWNLTAEQAATLLRGHWGIENRVFYVRDVTMDEDRLPGRKIGYSLSNIRNVALNLLRTLAAPRS